MAPFAVISVFLQVDAETLRLPAFEAATVWYLVYFLAALVLFFIFMHWRLRKQHIREALNNRFRQIMMRRGLTKSQISIALDFFASLHDAVKDEIFLSTKSLHHHLEQYLKSHTSFPAHDRTEIFDKLLPNSVTQIEIKNCGDLRLGEITAIDIGKKSHLATILKIKENMVLLSSAEKLETGIGAAIKLYAYRPHLGGFLISGEVVKTNAQSLVFKQTGGIEFKGDQHLMSEVALAFKIERWPHPDADVEAAEANESQHGIDAFSGFTEKISDRAMTVRFAANPPDWILKRQEYWEMTLELPEKPLICRVRILSHNASYLWLVRPVDLEQAERNRLYKFIADNNPVREHF